MSTPPVSPPWESGTSQPPLPSFLQFPASSKVPRQQGPVPQLVTTTSGAATVLSGRPPAPALGGALSNVELAEFAERFGRPTPAESNGDSQMDSQESQYHSSQEDELVMVIRKLVNHAVQIETQHARETVQHAAETSNLRNTLQKLQLDHTLLGRQASILARKVQEGATTGYSDGLGDGVYRTRDGNAAAEIERLRSDLRFVTHKLQESDNTVAALSTHLRSLRSHLLQSGPLIATDSEIALPVSGTSQPNPRKRKAALMGDAEAELLLLAGKSMSHIRRIWRVPIDHDIRIRAEEIIASKEGLQPETEDREHTPIAPPRTSTLVGASPSMADLLTAASRLLLPSRMSSGTAEAGPSGERLSKGAAPPISRPQHATASQSQQTFPASTFNPGGDANGASSSSMSALDLLASTSTTLSKAKRSPYIKWNLEEDECLIKAVLVAGQRWDQVAQRVPTRSYHQCRQRWLRGLRSGDGLPPELNHYKDEVKEAVRVYEASRSRKSHAKPKPKPAAADVEMNDIDEDNEGIRSPILERPYCARLHSGKSAGDLLSKDYPLAGNALEVKTRAPNNVAFKVAGTRDSKSNTIAGDIESKYVDPKNGVIFTQTWTTSNILKTQVELENQIAKGLKFDIQGQLFPATSAKAATVTAIYKQPSLHTRALLDVFKGPTFTADAVVGRDGFLLGAETTYSVPSGSITRYSVGAGYATPAYAVTLHGLANLTVFSASYYHKVSADVEAGAKAIWDSKSTASNVGLEVGAKAYLDPTAFIKAKINNAGIIGLGYTQALRPGVKASLGLAVDSTRLSTGDAAHKVGSSITFEA